MSPQGWMSTDLTVGRVEKFVELSGADPGSGQRLLDLVKEETSLWEPASTFKIWHVKFPCASVFDPLFLNWRVQFQTGFQKCTGRWAPSWVNFVLLVQKGGFWLSFKVETLHLVRSEAICELFWEKQVEDRRTWFCSVAAAFQSLFFLLQSEVWIAILGFATAALGLNSG